jgi:hypothetical protein
MWRMSVTGIICQALPQKRDPVRSVLLHALAGGSPYRASTRTEIEARLTCRCCLRVNAHNRRAGSLRRFNVGRVLVLNNN